jgi:GntR family transcriptional regulator, vanillate catabolism transcriptional regulator
MPRFQILHGASLADQAKDRIRAAILEGKLKPGEKITIERIAAEFGISRTPVREALKALETDNMVRLLPRRGAIVEPFAWREIQHRYAIRAMLEGYAAELACEKSDEKLLTALDRNCERLSKALANISSNTPAKLRALVELNHEFHHLFWSASESPTLLRIIESLRLPGSFSEYFWSVREYREVVSVHHLQITAAFRGRDSKLARKLTEQHLIAAGEMIAAAAQPGGAARTEADRGDRLPGCC